MPGKQQKYFLPNIRKLSRFSGQTAYFGWKALVEDKAKTVLFVPILCQIEI
jgi:hypothetical protein